MDKKNDVIRFLQVSMPLPPVEDISSLLEIDSNLKEWQDVDSFLEWHQQQLVKNKADKKP